MGRVCDLDWCNRLENILGKFNWKGLKDKMMKKKKEISILRSSAAEYLTFITATGESDVNAIYFDENVWLSQKTMGLLYNVETHTINYHLKKIFADCELDEASVIRKFRITASDGKGYNTNHYNLKAIIAVGNKVDSERAVQFRKWANGIIEEFTIKGFTMDDERLKNFGTILTKDYFEEQYRLRSKIPDNQTFFCKGAKSVALGDSWGNSGGGDLP